LSVSRSPIRSTLVKVSN